MTTEPKQQKEEPKPKLYWSNPFLVEVSFEIVIGFAIGYQRADKALIIIVPFLAIEIQYIDVNEKL